jgi:hypothetical protein
MKPSTRMGQRRIARRGGRGNVPQARVFLDKRTNVPVRVEVWRDGRWSITEFHVQMELPVGCETPEGS